MNRVTHIVSGTGSQATFGSRSRISRRTWCANRSTVVAEVLTDSGGMIRGTSFNSNSFSRWDTATTLCTGSAPRRFRCRLKVARGRGLGSLGDLSGDIGCCATSGSGTRGNEGMHADSMRGSFNGGTTFGGAFAELRQRLQASVSGRGFSRK